MSIRQIRKIVRGQTAIDGAGVRLVRVLGNDTVADFDPFLMLDSFDSKKADDYIRGFPMHPHRGIETITYLIKGEIEHQDSLGNKGAITSGAIQWMTAGSGILHQEMPKETPWLLGLQIWLNLPRENKMTHPAYFDITPDMIPEVKRDFGIVRVISGEFGKQHGVHPAYIQASLLDFTLEPGKEVILDTKSDENVFIFLIENDAVVDGARQTAKSAVLFGEGETIRVAATDTAFSRFLFFSGKPLREPVAWGGPIVMNTRQELVQAYTELEKGTFIRQNAKD